MRDARLQVGKCVSGRLAQARRLSHSGMIVVDEDDVFEIDDFFVASDLER